MQPFRVHHQPAKKMNGEPWPDKGEGWAMAFSSGLSILVAFDSGELIGLPASHLLLSGPIKDPDPQVVITGKKEPHDAQ